MTFNDLFMIVCAVKGGPKVLAIDHNMKCRVTLYCHHKMVSRIRNLDWWNIKPAGLWLDIKGTSHANLKKHLGKDLFSVKLVHEEKFEI